MGVSKQQPHVLEDEENMLLVWINKKQLSGDTVPESFTCKNAKALHTDFINKLPGMSSENEGFKARIW